MKTNFTTCKNPGNKSFERPASIKLSHSMVTLLVTIAIPGIVNAQDCIANLKRTAPDSRYIDLKDGTVKDKDTGLIWQRCGVGQAWDAKSNKCTGNAKKLTWQQALSGAKALGEGWRLPNVKELASLIEYSCSNPNINITMFPPLKGPFDTSYWSSTPRKGSIEINDAARPYLSRKRENLIHYVNFAGGNIYPVEKNPSAGASFYARAVKSEK